MKVSESIEALVAYRPGKPIEETQRELGLKQVYKLASNENPLGVSQKVLAALQKASKELHRYPDASCYSARQALSQYLQFPAEKIVLGNGSNELIDLLIRLYCEPGDSVVTSQFAFIAYKICAQVSRVHCYEAPMQENLQFDLAAISRLITQHKPKLVFIANPNNPTGTCLSNKELVDFLEEHKGNDELLIVLDEAYNEFVRQEDYPKSIELLKQYENLVVLRTFSKVFGLAGLRVGAALGNEEVVGYLNKIRNPFNVNSLAQEALIAALEDREYIQKSCDNNWAGLDQFYSFFNEQGIKYWPSQANFVLIDCGRPGTDVFNELLQMGVIVRPVAGYGLHTQVRISVGSSEENKKAIDALREVLK